MRKAGLEGAVHTGQMCVVVGMYVEGAHLGRLFHFFALRWSFCASPYEFQCGSQWQ